MYHSVWGRGWQCGSHSCLGDTRGLHWPAGLTPSSDLCSTHKARKLLLASLEIEAQNGMREWIVLAPVRYSGKATQVKSDKGHFLSLQWNSPEPPGGGPCTAMYTHLGAVHGGPSSSAFLSFLSALWARNSWQPLSTQQETAFPLG